VSKKEYIVDGRNCGDLVSTAREFTRALGWSTPWNGHLDAFNDFLNGGFGTPDEGFVLIWEHSDTSRRNLGYPETILWFEERVRSCHPSNASYMREHLETAKRLSGETLFDMLLDIVNKHDDIELTLK
jgi:hypothetical protein